MMRESYESYSITSLYESIRGAESSVLSKNFPTRAWAHANRFCNRRLFCRRQKTSRYNSSRSISKIEWTILLSIIFRLVLRLPVEGSTEDAHRTSNEAWKQNWPFSTSCEFILAHSHPLTDWMNSIDACLYSWLSFFFKFSKNKF
jgi:hypothetical protein